MLLDRIKEIRRGIFASDYISFNHDNNNDMMMMMIVMMMLMTMLMQALNVIISDQRRSDRGLVLLSTLTS